MVEPIHNLLGNCRPVSEEELNKVFDSLSIKLNELNLKFSPLGSFNKKKEGSLYNDLDIAVEYPFDKGLELVRQICKDNEDKTILGKYNNKFNTVSIGYKLGDGTNLQVDFMFCNNLEYAKFAFHSPDFNKNESKYKGMYASILLQSAIRNLHLYHTYFEDGSVKEYYYYSLSQKDGLIKKHKTFEGKKGNKVKTARLLDEEFISNDPSEILYTCFGYGPDYEFPNDVYTFERLLDFLQKFYYNNHHNKELVKEYLINVKHDFLTDWEFCLKKPDELKKEFEDLFNQKINSL